jgi:Cu2+-exporting ATPase
MPKCPVCGMNVDPRRSFQAEKEGRVYYFCSLEHRDRFLSSGRVSGPGAKAQGAGPAASMGEMGAEHRRGPGGSDRTGSHGGHGGHPGHGGHGGHHQHMIADFRRRFWASLAVTLPVLALSPMVQRFLGVAWMFPGSTYLLFALASFIYFYGGLPFLKGMAGEIRKRLPGMMTLIAVAITVAYVYSSLVVFGLKGQDFFWELVTLIDIMLLGHWIEMKSVLGASRALEELARLLPSEAHRVAPDGTVREVRVEDLEPGQRVLVKPGERVPADGVVVDGASEVNEAMLTGESKPVSKGRTARVVAGSINGSGSLTLEVAKTGAESYLAQVVELVRKASESKSRAQDIADRAAFWLTAIAVSVGAATLVIWVALGRGFEFSLGRMVTVMVITCPHALGLAVPLVVAVITALSARNGLLLRNRAPFEAARDLDVIVFDKTGTLTSGEFGLTDVVPLSGWMEDDVLRAAASLEMHSEHSLARGVVSRAEDKGLHLERAEGFEALPGKGARARVGGRDVFVGNEQILEAAGAPFPPEAREKFGALAAQGKSPVLVAAEGAVRGILALADLIRPESREAVRTLRDMGYEVSMITGDNPQTARYVADELGLDSHFAGVLPEKKSEKIKELQARGRRVAMVGDGVNDAPALAQADVGLAIGAGTDVAIEAADVVLVSSDPRSVVDVVRLSRLMHRKMVQNLAWATGYNVIAIPLAAGVLYRYGFVFPPAVGALVMSLSTIIVAINARLVPRLGRA